MRPQACAVNSANGGPSFLPSSSSSSSSPTNSQAYYYPQSNESYFSLTAQTLVTLSRGSVRLKSASIYNDPNIDPNYYADPTDWAIAINAFRDLRKLLAHPALQRFVVGGDDGGGNGEVLPGLANVPVDASEEVIFEFIKASTIPNWHASGTCRMLPGGKGGVVDERLRVSGVEGLRAVDVSVMPVLPDVNVVGPVYMVAERGAEIIREDWGIGGGSGGDAGREGDGAVEAPAGDGDGDVGMEGEGDGKGEDSTPRPPIVVDDSP